MKAGEAVLSVQSPQHQCSNDSKQDNEDCDQQDDIPEHIEWQLITVVQTVGYPIPVQCGVDTPPIIAPPKFVRRTLVAGGHVRHVDGVLHVSWDTREVISGTQHVSDPAQTGAVIGVVGELVTAIIGLQSLVTGVITVLHTITHLAIADTPTILTLPPRLRPHSIREVTVTGWRLLTRLTLRCLFLFHKALLSPLTLVQPLSSRTETV